MRQLNLLQLRLMWRLSLVKLLPKKMRNRIDKAVENISQFPMIGVSSFTDEETGIEFRELQCRINSVVYTIYNEEIYIVSIWSNRQNRNSLHSALKEDAQSLYFEE